MEDNKIYVAVGKNAEEREEILNWAIKSSRGEAICVIHVQVPAQMIPLPSNFDNSPQFYILVHILIYAGKFCW